MFFLLVVLSNIYSIFGAYEQRSFIFKGEISYSNRSHTIYEMISKQEISPSLCASLCRVNSPCRAFELCRHNGEFTCGLCQSVMNYPSGFNLQDGICHHYLMIENCRIGYYDWNVNKCIQDCGTFNVNTGVYEINIGGQAVEAWCERIGSETWTTVMKRLDGSISFYRGWTEYQDGFGNASSEYWIGNKNLHKLTSDGYTKLRFDLEDKDGNWKYALYDNFYVADAAHNYQLSINYVSGNAGDCMTYHDGMKFSTFDRDNDVDSSKDCAEVRSGAWWYAHCYHANLNGVYGEMSKSGVIWKTWKGFEESLKTVKMLIKKA